MTMQTTAANFLLKDIHKALTCTTAGVGDTRIFGSDSDTDTLSNTGPIPRPIPIPGMGKIRFQYRFWPFLGDSETDSILAAADRFL